MKRFALLIVIFTFVIGLASCNKTEETHVKATLTSFDTTLTSIVFTMTIDEGAEDITGVINVSLYDQDEKRVHTRDVTDLATFTKYKRVGLKNELSYTLKITATIGRQLEVIVEKEINLPSAETMYITTVEEFMNMSSNRVGNYVLQNDLDFENKPFTTPFTRAFAGTFDGQGFTLKNIKFDAVISYTGVFGYVSTGQIRNVNFDNISIGTNETPLVTQSSSMVGIVAGYVNGQTAIIENIHVTNSTIAYETSSTVRAQIGIIAGDNRGSIQNVTSENTSISLKTSSYGAINVGGAVGNLGESALLKEVMMDVDIHVNFAGENLKDREIKVNVGGVIGYHNAINYSRSVEHIVSKGDILVDLDFGTAETTTEANYSVNIGGIAGIAMSNVHQALVMGSIAVNHEANLYEENVSKYINIGGLYGFYRSSKASLANLKLADETSTIIINMSDDVILKVSQLVASNRSTAQNVFRYFGPKHLVINDVDQTDTDTIDVLTDMLDFFDSEWIETYMPA